MTAITDLLSAAPEEFVQKLLPTGDYICQIMDAELLHGYWKPNPTKGRPARWFECYVPTIEIVDALWTGDEDVDADLKQALERFGDWQGFRPPNGSGNWTQFQEVPGYNDKVRCAGIANGLNFILAEATPEWAGMKDLATSAARFYNSENAQGEVGGWVASTLSTDASAHTPPAIGKVPLGEVIEATKGCFLVVSLTIEEDPKGEYEPKLVCSGTTSV